MGQCKTVVAASDIPLASSQMGESHEDPASLLLEIKSCLTLVKAATVV
jgi:hypothetical protein